MNLLDIIFLAVLAFYFISGMYRGLITSLLATGGFIASFYGALKLMPKLATAALSNTTLMAVLSQYLEADSFFASTRQALTTVDTVVQGGENAIQSVIGTLSTKLAWVSDAFELNVRNEKFASLGINTLADYLDQTVWVAVFHLLGFIVAFILLYCLCCLIVNLLDSVVRWPVLRGVDSLLGGFAGLVRGLIVCAALMFALPTIVSVFAWDFAQELINTSKLYSVINMLDFMEVRATIMSLLKA